MNDEFIITDLHNNGKYPIKVYSEQGKSMIYIIAYIIDNCNYNCQYCYNKMPRTFKSLNLDYLYTFISQMSENNLSGKRIGIGLIGGEPSLHPDILKFVNNIYNLDNKIFIEFFTNFSYPIDFYIQLLEKNVSVVASWHSINSDMNNYSFIEKIKSIPFKYYTNNQMVIRIMMGNNDWEYAKNAFFELREKYNDYIEISLLTDKSGPMMEYSKEQLREFQELKSTTPYNKELFILEYEDGSIQKFSMQDLFLNPQLNFKFWKCEAGLNNLYIHVDGNIYNCQSYYETNLKPIYNLNDCKGEYKKNMFKDCICKSQYCSCDFEVPKKRIFMNWYGHA